ncbi:carbonic anhydrase [Ancylobacter oerskovii]|uniref:Carbonic anhydrase n=1 Tax=Ancylobacter oerskovii TaxID=459519 RepID=A0ABW4Z3N4_9HYPH|nr:carbonic anhydrase [Ancylobacter oerskovii]MBS7546004.1 carbonic anhydrase [Ancylobacter oerskovii]
MSFSPVLSRRNLFGTLACGCAAAAVGFGSSPVLAASGVARTELSADAALAKLKEGNAAFVAGGACTPAGGTAHISPLAVGQAPFAVVIGCSDSRTPPELVFNTGLGELFIIRVAGNTVDASAIGSIEYGVSVLGAPLVLVMGHSQCGAVQAAIQMATEGTHFPGSIDDLVQPILPAVLRSRHDGHYLVADAVRANVEDVTARIAAASPVVAQAVAAKKVRVVGSVYDLASGKVDFLA